MLFISSGKDEIVPPEQMSKLHQAVKHDDEVWYFMPNGDHNANWF